MVIKGVLNGYKRSFELLYKEEVESPQSLGVVLNVPPSSPIHPSITIIGLKYKIYFCCKNTKTKTT